MTIESLIATYKDPYLQTDYASLGCFQTDSADPTRVHIRLPYPAAAVQDQIRRELCEHLQAGGIANPQVITEQRIPRLNPLPETADMGGVKNIIAVASGKGGVGKSTLSVSLALGLKEMGAKTGLLDADIYGPSQGYLLGAKPDKAKIAQNKKLLPQRLHGLDTMSLAYLMDEDQTPAIWRGSMASRVLQQLLLMTDWKELDYLVIDLPPGTGDIQLTLCQRISLSGAIIVTTPHDLALMGAAKGIAMFRKLYVPLIGMIENMSHMRCASCNTLLYPFGKGGAARLAAKTKVPLIGELPLTDMTAGNKEISHLLAKSAVTALSRLGMRKPPTIRVLDD